MINNLQTKCLSLDIKSNGAKSNPDPKSGDDVDDNKEMSNEGNILIATKLDECEWKGPIKNWMDHSKQCGFIIIGCIHCNNYQSQRRKMKLHHDVCPKMVIPCLLSCGLFIYIYVILCTYYIGFVYI